MMEAAVFFAMAGLLAALGIVASYTDISSGKIRNKHLIIFSVAFLLLVMLFSPIVSFDYLFMASNLAFAFILALLFWSIGFWTAADAKLYMVFSLFLSSFIRPEANAINYPFFSLVILTFIPFFIFFAGVSVAVSSKRHIIEKLAAALNPKSLLATFIIIFVIQWPMAALSKVISTELLSLPIMFMIYYLLEKIKLNKAVVFIVLACGRLIFDKSVYSFDFLLYLALVSLLFSLVKRFFIDLGFMSFCKETDISRIKEGMVPAEVIYKKGKRYEKKDIPFFGLSWYDVAKYSLLFRPKPEGLTASETRKIKKIAKSANFKILKTYQTLPFAPFLFTGAILYIALSLAQGNIFL